MAARLLRVDLQGLQSPHFDWDEAAFAARRVALLHHRQEILRQAQLPAELLNEYHHERKQSVVGKILSAARQLQERVDRVVICGNASAIAAARALFAAGCHPYHNEQSRGERAGYPRVYFAGDSADNDAAQGLLYLLGNGRVATQLEDRWGLIVVESSANNAPAVALLPLLLAHLLNSCGGDQQRYAERQVTISENLSTAPICPTFLVPAGLGTFASLSPLGLMPAAIMGLDVLRLLQGAQELTKNFEQAPPEENAALSFAAVRSMLFERGIRGLDFRWWQPSLRGFAPFSPTAQTAPGLRVNVIAERPRCDPLPQLAEVQAEEIETARQAERERGEPAIDILLPSTQVMILGQLLQFFALQAALETTMPVMPSGENC